MSKYSILLGTPCYGNQMLRGYFHSVIKLKELCQMHNIELEISTIGNESLITRGRNYFVSLLLSEKKYTHLLFVDADISFDPMSVIRMIESDKDVVAGCYPKKSINWEKVRELVADSTVNNEYLEQMSHDYALNIVTKIDNGAVSIPIVNGFMKVSYVATGFLLIKREVLEKMVKAHPEYKYNNDVGGYDNGKNKEYFYSVFDCIIDPHSKRYLSEDYAFCCRWIELGGDIWVDLLCNLNHTGSYEFKGSYFRIIEHLLERQKQGILPQPLQQQPPVSKDQSEINEQISNIKKMLKEKSKNKRK